ncbi:MAG TPA: acyltransferase [Clostridia bacterium]|nr:acyltransferase [Clostridia bacterium]
MSVHPSADVSDQAELGTGTRVWHEAQVREGAVIGVECVIGKGVYVDAGVHIGNRCKLQNGVFVFHGFNLEDGVFLGPGVMLLNDKNPRAINADGSLKSDADWTTSQGLVMNGASVGGGVVVLPGVSIGRFAMVGSGAVVTKDVPDHGLVYGNPARLKGFSCMCGNQLNEAGVQGVAMTMDCPACGRTVSIPVEVYEKL